MACKVGGASPESVWTVRATTRRSEVGGDSGVSAIWDSRTNVFGYPTGRPTKNGATAPMGGRAVSYSWSGYTDNGAIARTVRVEETGSPRDSNQFRSAPVITASTTSLMAQP